MNLTSKRRLELDIWPETSQQIESIENIIKTSCNIEAMWRQKASKMPNCLLVPINKEAKHVYILLFMISIHKIANLGIHFGLNHGLWSLSNRKNVSADRILLLAV